MGGSGGSPGDPDLDRERDLHRRLLAGNPAAPSVLAAAYLEPLTIRLRRRFPRVDPHLVETAAIDSVLNLAERPERYKPARSGLFAYLYMDASGDLRNALKSERRHEVRRTPLEHLLGDRRRLEAVARRNLVVVAPSKEPRCRELFFIRAGRLVDQRRLELPARSDRLRRALRVCFPSASSGQAVSPPGPIEREVVDEMRQLDGWLRRERAVLRTVPVDPADPEAALPLLLEAVREPAGTTASP